jgi:hypothetical protein
MPHAQIDPTAIQPGHRLPNLDGDGPAVLSVDPPSQHPDLPIEVVAVVVEGEDDPRLIPTGNQITVALPEEPS